jgi:multiple sugar transport system substrate-binding protein
VLRYADEFTKLTGITLKVDSFQEQQARQRMLTILQSKSPDMDIFMSLKSRDGLLYSRAGWYADIYPLAKAATAPDYALDDFGKGALDGEIFSDRLTGIPLNVEGPVLYYRKDVFKELGLAPPATLADIEAACKVIKEKRPDLVPFVSRGLKSALPFTFSVFIHNMGGEYITPDGKSNLSSPPAREAVDVYARLLRDYGPPGVVNYTFYQISTLYREGKAAMAFEATNEFNSMMEGGARLQDTAIMILPAGPTGLVKPTVIGWGLSISNFSQKQEAAWYFIQWATSPAMQERLIADGICPPRMSALNSKTFQKWQEEAPIRKEWAETVITLSRTGTSNVYGPNVVNQPEGRDYVGQAVNDVILGARSLDDAVANADRLVDAMLAKEK